VAQIITGNNHATLNDVIEWIKNLCKDLNTSPLSFYGVKKEDFETIADKAAASSSMAGNPIKLTKQELLQILEASW